MAIDLTGKINAVSANVPNIDKRYGPYTSVAGAIAATSASACNGLTVGICSGSELLVEYIWTGSYKSGGVNLVPKSSAGTDIVWDTISGSVGRASTFAGTASHAVTASQTIMAPNYVPLLGSAELSGNYSPKGNEKYDLGSAATRWKSIYAKEVIADSIAGTGSVDYNSLIGISNTSTFAGTASYANSASQAVSASWAERVEATNSYITNLTSSIISASGYIKALEFTGSLDGTASQAITALSAPNYVPLAGTRDLSGNFVPSATNIFDLGTETYTWHNAWINNVTASNVTATKFTGDLVGTATQATSATSALTASRVEAAKGYVTNLTSSIISASQVSAIGFTGSLYGTASHVATASYAPNYVPLIGTKDFAGNFIPLTTNAFNLGSETFIWHNAWINNVTASNVTATKFTGPLIGTASQATLATTALTASRVEAAKGYVTNLTSSIISASSYVKAPEFIGNLTGTASQATVAISAPNYIPLAGSTGIVGNLSPVTTDAFNLGSETSAWHNAWINNVSASSVTATRFVGPLVGTASQAASATSALTASRVEAVAGYVTNLTSSIISASQVRAVGFTGSLYGTASQATSASQATTAISAPNYIPLAGSTGIVGNLVPLTTNAFSIGSNSFRWNSAWMTNITASNVTATKFTGTLVGTASQATLATTASRVEAVAGYVTNLTSSIISASSYVSASSLSVAGNIYAGGDVIAYYASDRALKEQIEPLVEVDRVLSELRPVQFTWNSVAENLSEGSKKGKARGFIADEYVKVLPNTDRKIWEDYTAIDYMQVIPYLVAGYQAQKQELHDLKLKLEKDSNQ